mgnify:CR=1 FL=1
MRNYLILILLIFFCNLYKFDTAFSTPLKVHIFCNMEKYHHIQPRLEISKVFFKKGNIEYMVNLNRTTIEPKENFGQVYLGSVEVPEGDVGFYIYLNKVFVKDKELVIENDHRILKTDLKFPSKAGRILLLFITWNVASSFKDDKFTPVFTFSFEEKPRAEELLLALDKENKGVWVVDSIFNRVVYFIELNGEPEYMSYDKEKFESYVLTSKDRLVKVINIKTLNIDRVYPIMPLEKPEYMSTDKRGNGVIVSPPDRKILLLDFFRGSILNLRHTEFEPGYVCYVPQINVYFLSSSENTVYILDENLNKIGRLDTLFTPKSIFTDGEYLYVLDKYGGVLIYSLPSLSFYGRLNVCASVLNGLSVENKVYFACEDGYIPYLYKGQRNVADYIKGRASFYGLAYSTYKKWLYVGSNKKNVIAVIDVYNDRIKGYIELGGPVQEIVAFP